MEITRTLTPRQFVGSGVVKAARYDDQSTTLKLRTFAGVHLRYTIACVPDPAGAAEFWTTNSRPIAVKIQQGGKRCTATALTDKGARTSQVSLGTALALHQSGVHAIVDGGQQTGVTCSARPTVHGCYGAAPAS